MKPAISTPGPSPRPAAEPVADDDRAEHALHAAVEQVVEQRLPDQQPQPGVPEHLAGAVAEVVEHARRVLRTACGGTRISA